MKQNKKNLVKIATFRQIKQHNKYSMKQPVS